MASRKTIVLFIIFLALLAYVYFFEIQGEKRKQAQKEREELVLNFDEEKISGLSFLPAGIHLEKINIQWQILSPVETDADQAEVENILNAFNSLKRGRFVSDNPGDFHSFGLTPYQSALAIDEDVERSDTLFIGDTNLDNTKVFYRISGSNNVYLVPTTLKNNAEKSLYDLRDKTIVSFDRDSVTEIEFQYPDFSFHCFKDSANNWSMVQPDSGLAKSWKVSSLLYDINDIEVAEFIDESYKPDTMYGFNRPGMKIKLKNGEDTVCDLVFGKKTQNNVYLKNNLTNVIYLVRAKIKKDLVIETNDYIKKN